MVNTPARARLAIHGVAGGGHHEALRDMPDGSAAERQVLPRLRLSLGTPRLPRVLHHTPGERQVLPRVRPLDGDLLDGRRRGNEPRVDGRGSGGDRPRADGRGGGGDLGPRLARRVVVVAARSEAGVPQMQGVEARLRSGAADLRAVRAPRVGMHPAGWTAAAAVGAGGRAAVARVFARAAGSAATTGGHRGAAGSVRAASWRTADLQRLQRTPGARTVRGTIVAYGSLVARSLTLIARSPFES